ncbi:DUF6152 family protein [Altererythrobacter sp. KTW20L]|jgi:hypothetical protein|uniref:DUF6152 family protein n=1 Tax=Altererythrobacter sp. KTW20L TaxID=2942210 RepID=UPI0020BD6830|nr:DUF6152 family protein [Altererythrobacter sp. KTW20L]MCL6250763.1 DUF6152 family protein [Altererythrobacter sp. KTW20L]
MQLKKLSIAAIGAVLAVTGVGAAAHHSFATEFDRNKPVRLEGKVVMFEWVNPHSWIHIDVQRNNRTERWRVEGGAPSALLRRGWNRNSLPAGTDIIVDAFQARDGDTRASAAEIRFPNGRELSLGNPTTEAVAAAARRAQGN